MDSFDTQQYFDSLKHEAETRAQFYATGQSGPIAPHQLMANNQADIKAEYLNTSDLQTNDFSFLDSIAGPASSTNNLSNTTAGAGEIDWARLGDLANIPHLEQ